MILLSHPTGNQFVRNAALALHSAGLLAEFWTSIAWRKQSVLSAFLPAAVLRELQRRSFPEEIESKIRTRPLIEVGRLTSKRFHIPGLRERVFSVDAVYRHIDEHVSRRIQGGVFSGIYAYEDGAARSFRSARKAGITTLYDLPIGYWRAGQEIYREEAERMPEWRDTLPGLNDCSRKLERKDEELLLSDAVFVASRFTASTLKKAPFSLPEPIIIPYRCGTPNFGICVPDVSQHKGPLRVLYVGSLSQRKGIYELFRAVEALGTRVSLTVVGAKVGRCPARDRYLQTHRWIETLSHPEVLALMQKHDVLVFPSLFEGFGLVITEALSQGLPVITTSHTCGPDILTDGEDGFLVPIRSWESIAEKLELLDRDRDRLAKMKQCALQAAGRNPWTDYRTGIISAVRDALPIHNSRPH